MKAPAALCMLAFVSLSAQNARADEVRIPTSFSTSGSFNCHSSIVCGGEGTNSITVGSGANTATLTFTGVTHSFDATNHLQLVPFGEFFLTAPEGFTFPARPGGPATSHHWTLQFGITLHQTTTIDSVARRGWEFRPGGPAGLLFQRGEGFFVAGLGPTPFNYSMNVYTLRSFPFVVEPNTTISLSADVAAVPEPTSMVLLGTGLVGTLIARRRASRARDSGIRTPGSAI